jgi:Fe-S-cluster containining protein
VSASEGFDFDGFYRRLDAALSKVLPKCGECGKCCDFPNAGHVLYATEIEADYLIKKSSLPAAAASALEKGLCPYWRDGKCEAHPFRTLGCRTFHHDRKSAGEAQEIHERFLGILRNESKGGAGLRYAPLLDIIRDRMQLGETKPEN